MNYKLIIFLILSMICSCKKIEYFDDYCSTKSAEFIREKKVLSKYSYNFDNTSGYVENKNLGTITHLSGGGIYTFDVGLGEVVDYYDIPAEGPRSMGKISKFDASIYIGNGKYIYANHFENSIYCIRPDTVYKIHQLSSENNERLASSYQNTPIIGHEGQYLFPIFGDPMSDLSQTFAFVAIDSSLTQVQKVINFPEIYDEFYFSSTPYFYFASIIYVEEEKEYYVSFPADLRLHRYSVDFNYLGFLSSPDIKKDYIDPLLMEKEKGEYEDWSVGRQYYRESNHSVGLKYLDSRRTFLRMFREYDVEGDFHSFYLVETNLTNNTCTRHYLKTDYRAFNNFSTQDDKFFILNLGKVLEDNESTLIFEELLID